MQTVELKRKTAEGWVEIPLDYLRGKTLGDAMLELDGQEVVARFDNTENGKAGYFCGTQKWLEYYIKKGFTAITFKQAVELLRKKGSPLVDFVCPPLMERVADVFPDSTLGSVTAGDELFC